MPENATALQHRGVCLSALLLCLLSPNLNLMKLFASREIQAWFGCVSSNSKSGLKCSFVNSVHTIWEAVLDIADQEHSRGDVKPLVGVWFYFAELPSVSTHPSLVSEAQPRCAQILLRLGRSFCKAGSWARGREGVKEAAGKFYLVPTCMTKLLHE